MTATLPPPLSERDQRALERILESFEKTHTRIDAQFSRLRQHIRQPYRGVISLVETTRPDQSPPKSVEGFPIGWTYSLSQGGVGFVSLDILRESSLLVGLHLPAGGIKWLRGQIVRLREIPEERFLDYGVAFGTSTK